MENYNHVWFHHSQHILRLFQFLKHLKFLILTCFSFLSLVSHCLHSTSLITMWFSSLSSISDIPLVLTTLSWFFKGNVSFPLLQKGWGSFTFLSLFPAIIVSKSIQEIFHEAILLALNLDRNDLHGTSVETLISFSVFNLIVETRPPLEGRGFSLPYTLSGFHSSLRLISGLSWQIVVLFLDLWAALFLKGLVLVPFLAQSMMLLISLCYLKVYTVFYNSCW